MNFYRELQTLLGHDAGGRGLAAAGLQLPLAEVTRELCRARHTVILTGFPVQSAAGLVGETDGPVGSAHLAAALLAVGGRVTVLTDATSLPMVKAALDSAAPQAALGMVCPGDDAKQLLCQLHPTHLIALERPGKAADGHFYSMRGRVLDAAVTETDTLFAKAKAAGVTTIAVGDGGNELGMGGLRETIKAVVPYGEQIASAQAADYALVSGVSNWWGWGMAALLSAAIQKNLLPDEAQDTAVLAAVAAAGGVDGCTGKSGLSVDGLPQCEHLAVLRRLHGLLARQLNFPVEKGITA